MDLTTSRSGANLMPVEMSNSDKKSNSAGPIAEHRYSFRTLVRWFRNHPVISSFLLVCFGFSFYVPSIEENLGQGFLSWLDYHAPGVELIVSLAVLVGFIEVFAMDPIFWLVRRIMNRRRASRHSPTVPPGIRCESSNTETRLAPMPTLSMANWHKKYIWIENTCWTYGIYCVYLSVRVRTSALEGWLPTAMDYLVNSWLIQSWALVILITLPLHLFVQILAFSPSGKVSETVEFATFVKRQTRVWWASFAIAVGFTEASVAVAGLIAP